VTVTCDLCGLSDPGDEPPLSWSLSIDRGQAKRYCEQCTRQHLRSMEGKLDQAHW
jgi:hypothetical protein